MATNNTQASPGRKETYICWRCDDLITSGKAMLIDCGERRITPEDQCDFAYKHPKTVLNDIFLESG